MSPSSDHTRVHLLRGSPSGASSICCRTFCVKACVTQYIANAPPSTSASMHGILLVTGPTSSGESTTLYAALQELNSTELNILTLEDPIEYQLEGISQTQVSEKKGMTFATGLRTVLRQDPDVIMVGEIRDEQPARMAVQSPMTGHPVFSTLHTNDAAGAVARLLDLGIEPYRSPAL